MRGLIATLFTTALISAGCQEHGAGGAATYRGGPNSSGANLGDNAASINNRGTYNSDARAAPIGGSGAGGLGGGTVGGTSTGTGQPPAGAGSGGGGTGDGTVRGSRPVGGNVDANDANGNRTGSGNSGQP